MSQITNGNNFVERARSAELALEANAQRALNEQINASIVALEPEKDSTFERSKIARVTDDLASIPIIGSLFGLARLIGSAAVAAYYKWNEKSISNSGVMLLRAKDEAMRGLHELIPFGGLLLQHDGLEKTLRLRPGAAGKFYCKHDDKLYYSDTSLSGRKIQWIRTADIKPYKMSYEALTATFSRRTEFEVSVYVQNQGRVIDNETDAMGPLLTYSIATEIRDLGPVSWE